MLLPIALTFVACAKKGTDFASTNGTPVKTNSVGLVYSAQDKAFLSPSDFTTNNPFILDSQDVTTEINRVGDLWRYYSVDQSSLDSTEATASQCDYQPKIKLISADHFSVGASLDLKNCSEVLLQKDSGLSFAKYKIRFYSEYKCEGVDFSAYDGVTLTSDLATKLNAACSNKVRGYLSNRSVELDFTMTDSTGSSHAAITELYSRWNSSGGLCVHTPQPYWIEISDACQERFKTHYSGTGDPLYDNKDDIIRLNSLGLTMSKTPTDPFYSAGQKEIFLMGWGGAITYSGAKNQPTWEVTLNGSKVSGVLPVAPPALSGSSGLSAKATNINSLNSSSVQVPADQRILQKWFALSK